MEYQTAPKVTQPRLSRAEILSIRNGEACSGCEQHPEIQRDLADTALALMTENEGLRDVRIPSMRKSWGDALNDLRTAEARIARLEALLNAAPLCHMNGYNGVRCCDVHAFYERRRALFSEPQDVEGAER